MDRASCEQIGIGGLPRPGPHQQPAVLQHLRIQQQQHQPAQPGERRTRAVGRQPELDRRPPRHEVWRGRDQLVRQPLHAQHFRQSDFRQLLVHRHIHRQCLRRFPAGLAAIGDAHGAIPAAVYSLPRLGGLRAGRFQSHAAPYPDVRPAVRIQRPGVHAERQYLSRSTWRRARS